MNVFTFAHRKRQNTQLQWRAVSDADKRCTDGTKPKGFSILAGILYAIC